MAEKPESTVSTVSGAPSAPVPDPPSRSVPQLQPRGGLSAGWGLEGSSWGRGRRAGLGGTSPGEACKIIVTLLLLVPSRAFVLAGPSGRRPGCPPTSYPSANARVSALPSPPSRAKTKRRREPRFPPGLRPSAGPRPPNIYPAGKAPVPGRCSGGCRGRGRPAGADAGGFAEPPGAPASPGPAAAAAAALRSARPRPGSGSGFSPPPPPPPSSGPSCPPAPAAGSRAPARRAPAGSH